MAGFTEPITKVPVLDRLKSKKGLVRRIPVYLDSEAILAYEEAQAEVDDLTEDDSRRPEAVGRLAEAKAALGESTVTLVLRRPEVTYDDEDGVTRTLRGRQAYEWLMENHPPTDEQNAQSQAEHSVNAPYDADTFAPALIAACCDDPKMTPEEADELISEWTLPEVMVVFSAAMEICNTSQVGPLGKGSGRTQGY